ncbi:uncharacterized protein LOC144711965 isoform X2 [Wolffia australiana]
MSNPRSDLGSEPAVGIVISIPEGDPTVKTAAAKKVNVDLGRDREDDFPDSSPTKKGFPRSESYSEDCRCRGELAKAHLSCIKMWFHTKGSNKCEICQETAVNVPHPDTQPSANYWIWRIEPVFSGSNVGQTDRERGCLNPLWIAFCILIGGLLLDVLISVSLGVSALPANIIIGVLIMLGLGTALRLSLECCHRRSLQQNNNAAPPVPTISNPTPPASLQV